MLRIVGLQKDDTPDREFLLLQNQGSMRLNLRGHVIMSDGAIDRASLSEATHAFPDEVLVPPGMYVLLFTGHGVPRWCRTKDGTNVFYSYMGRDRTIWTRTDLPLHVMCTQHTYAERGEALLLR